MKRILCVASVAMSIVAGLVISVSEVKAAAPATPTGYITFRTYPGDVRAAVAAGPAVTPALPPDGVFYPKHMEGPFNGYPGPDLGTDDPPPGDLRNNYTTELVGYFYPPKSGKVQFAIATDDPGAMYFSTDDNPANKKQVATESGWNPVRSFGGAWDGMTATRRTTIDCGDPPVPRPENWSAYFTVTQGKPYFIQSIHAEYGGGDNNAIAYHFEGDPDFMDGDIPIPGAVLSPISVPTVAAIVGQPRDTAVYAGSVAVFSVAVDAPPTVTITSTKWTKNGADVANSDTNTLAVVAALGDDGAKFKAIITTSAGTLTSTEATLTVATISSDFATGVVKFEAWTGIGGTSVDGLLTDPHYLDPPDDTRLLGGIDSPNGYGDNYGARLTGFVIPGVDGDYRFFIRSDDASQFLLSPDSDPAKAVLICEETGCCNAFAEPDDPKTSPPQTLKAGTKYAFVAYLKEGGGGDYVQVAWRKEGDTTPASALTPITGSAVGANAKPSKGVPQITKQPQGLPQLQEGRTGRLTVDGNVTPAGFNFPLLVQWQKDGVNIPGANGKIYEIRNAAAANSGTYRAVVSAPSGISTNSADATVTVVPDIFPPVPLVGALLKGGKTEIGVGFDEDFKIATANSTTNYSLSAGTIESVRVVNRPASGFDASLGIKEYNSIVLVASGLTAGQTYQLTVKNVEDLKGNKIPAAGVVVSFKAEDKKTWTVVGAHEAGAGFVDDAVRVGDEGFDIMSSGVGFWADYDEATFVNEKVTGNFDKIAQLEYQDPSSQWSRCGLMAREALDEGKGRPDHGTCDSAATLANCVLTFCVPQTNLFSRLQTVHANPTIRADAGVANNSYENHWRSDDTYTAAWANQMNSADGGFGPLDYPNVWMRMARQGDTLMTYRSTDGVNWNRMTTRTFANLKPDLYVGPFLGPELSNNSLLTNVLFHSVLAKFRNVRDFGGVTQPPGQKISFTQAGTALTISWAPTGGRLQSTPALLTTGTVWTDVGTANPTNVTIGTGNKFLRVINP